MNKWEELPQELVLKILKSPFNLRCSIYGTTAYTVNFECMIYAMKLTCKHWFNSIKLCRRKGCISSWTKMLRATQPLDLKFAPYDVYLKE